MSREQGIEVSGTAGGIFERRFVGLARAVAHSYANVGRPTLKRAMDVSLAALILILASPVFLVLWALVRLDGGAAIYAHRRVGRGGQEFDCFKFRSMVLDADARLAVLLSQDPDARLSWERFRKLDSDPRVTRLGRFLRVSSLDELPQLLNVIRGEMSLVGPRPVTRNELDEHYGAAAVHYASVRPGITGLWQVSGRSDIGYRRRVELDVDYATNPSIMRDILLILKTPLVVFSGRGAR